jgi:hypothetical protein
LSKSHGLQFALAGASGICALLAFSSLALAQARDVACKKTETQAECHARLKCKPDEELEACQKRLLKCRANESVEDCQKRVSAEPARQERNDAEKQDRERSGQDRGRDFDPNDRGDQGDSGDRGDRFEHGGGDRDYGDQERGDRGDRGNGGRQRRQRGGGGGGGGGDGGGYGASKTFGLGLELGEPTGLNGKYFFSDSAALDFGLGWIYSHYYYGDGFHIYADFLWHPVSLASTPSFELPFYIGVGLRLWEFEYCDQRICNYDGSAVGIRIPFGLAFDFNNLPLDIFIQLVPVLDFVNGDYYDRYRDRTHLGIDVSAGFRYWFK